MRPYRQWTRYSCGAAVFQMAMHHFTGRDIPHEKAMAYLGCKPHGVTFRRLRKEFRECSLQARYIPRSATALDRALRDKQAVLVDDLKTWRNPHFVMVIGSVRNAYVVIDPIIGVPTLRSKRRVIASAATLMSVGNSAFDREQMRRAAGQMW